MLLAVTQERAMQHIHKAEQTGFSMNTLISHTVYGKRAGSALRAVRLEMQRLEQLFSRFLPGSDVSRINTAAGLHSVRIAPDTWKILQTAACCARHTDGCFDITIAPLVALWHRAGYQPKDSELAQARAFTGYESLALHRFGRKAHLALQGQSIDMGGIGKGYAADKAIAVFRRYGIRSAFTDFGGNIAVLGSKPDGSPWNIGIRNPQKAGAIIGTLQISDQSVVTSGDDQRAVAGEDGVHRSHIIDPRTGMPVTSGLRSVTVVSPSSAIADALATALYVTGMRHGLTILSRFPGTQAVFIDQDAHVWITGGLMQCFHAVAGTNATVLQEEIG